MIETLMGTLLGGMFRMAPELLKWFDRKDERKHELAMFDRQLEADKLKAQAAQAQAESQITLADIEALTTATKAQGQITGVSWVDGLNALMRPTITFWWVIVLYTGALVAQYLFLVDSGTKQIDAILHLWGTEEKAIVASIIAFWFVDRSLRHINNGKH